MEVPLSPAAYKDRSTALKAFGLFTIFFGVLCVGTLLLIIGSQLMTSPKGAAALPVSMLVAYSSFYLVLAGALIWLGIGSFLARRWARALLVIGSWSALAFGLMGTIGFAFMIPHLLQVVRATGAQTKQPMPDSVILMAMIIPMLFMAVIYIILPLIWALFYTSRHTRLTCEARDLQVRWTDRCPLPVLAMALWLLLTAVIAPLAAVFMNGVLPFFGILLSGPLGIVAWLALGGLNLFLAWSAYHLKSYAWWAVLILMGLLVLSNFLTYSHLDFQSMYGLMGYSPEMASRMALMVTPMQSWMAWVGLISVLPWAAYSLWVRRYFVTDRSQVPPVTV